ncbi:MAG: GDSL-type esterase/lipase family protein [Tepidiformaceae bacterium]
MRVLVFGHSDAEGSRLTNPDQAWPWILQRELPERAGEAVEVVHCGLYPTTPNAIGYIDARLHEHQPDVVLLNLSSHQFALHVVAGRVRELFGARASDWVLRRQRFLDARVARTGPLGSRSLYGVRRLTRAIIGTAPMVPYEVVVEAYAAVVRRLAREEGLHIVVVGGTRFSAMHQRLNKGLVDQIDRFKESIRTVVEEHRLNWVDNETVFGAVDRATLYLADGIHRSELGHRLLADALLPPLAGMARSGAGPQTARAG